MTAYDIARVCHEANKALCEGQGDLSQVDWIHCPQWQRDSAIDGEEFCLKNPNFPASANHGAWMKEKIADGWVWGSEKDPGKKEHPCIVPYHELPDGQRAKDHLFKAIVDSLRGFVENHV